MNRLELKAVETATGLQSKDFAVRLGITPRYLRSLYSGKESYVVSDTVTAKAIEQAKKFNDIASLSEPFGSMAKSLISLTAQMVFIKYASFEDYKVYDTDSQGDEMTAWQAASIFYVIALAVKGEGFVHVVEFDPSHYKAYLDGNVDSRDSRSDWATQQCRYKDGGN